MDGTDPVPRILGRASPTHKHTRCASPAGWGVREGIPRMAAGGALLSSRTMIGTLMRSWIALSALVLGACKAETFSPPTAGHFEVIVGAGQQGAPGSLLAQPIALRLIDTEGRPMPGIHLTWWTSAPDAAIEAATDSTDAEGVIGLRWRLGHALGPQTLQVDARGESSVRLEAVSAALLLDTMVSGFFFGCGIDHAGVTWCWGDNVWSRLGTADYSESGPVAVGGDSLRFVELALGWGHACGRTAAGEVWCWGSYEQGQIGDGRTGGGFTGNATPVRAVGLPPVVELAAANNATCARTAAGALWCWGSSSAFASTAVPVPVQSSWTFTDIALGGSHICATVPGGQVVCWGSNFSGQLGLGAGGPGSVSTPTPIARTIDAVRVVSGRGGSCAISTAGALYCWGDIIGLPSAERAALGADYPALIDVPAPVRGASLGYYCGAIWAGVGAPRFLCRGWTDDLESSGAPFAQVEYGDESLCVRTPEGVVYCKSYSDTGSLPYYDYSARAIAAPDPGP